MLAAALGRCIRKHRTDLLVSGTTGLLVQIADQNYGPVLLGQVVHDDRSMLQAFFAGQAKVDRNKGQVLIIDQNFCDSCRTVFGRAFPRKMDYVRLEHWVPGKDGIAERCGLGPGRLRSGAAY